MVPYLFLRATVNQRGNIPMGTQCGLHGLPRYLAEQASLLSGLMVFCVCLCTCRAARVERALQNVTFIFYRVKWYIRHIYTLPGYWKFLCSRVNEGNGRSRVRIKTQPFSTERLVWFMFLADLGPFFFLYWFVFSTAAAAMVAVRGSGVFYWCNRGRPAPHPRRTRPW